MTIIFQDTFSTVVDEALLDHTPDTGTAWLLLNSTYTAGDVLVKATGGSGEAGVVGPESNQNNAGVSFVTSPAPLSPEYDITVTIYSHNFSINNTYLRGVFGRYSAGDAYFLVILPNGHANPSLRLYKRVSGSNTLLGEADVTLDNGDEIKLEIRDAAKKVYHNNSEVISSADNALTGAGDCGIFFGNEFGLGGHIDRRQEFGEFTLDDQGASGVVTVEPDEVDFYGDGVDPDVDVTEPASIVIEPVATQFWTDGSDPEIVITSGYVEVFPDEVEFYVTGDGPSITYNPPPPPPPVPVPAAPYEPRRDDRKLPTYQVAVLSPDDGTVRRIWGTVGLELRYSRVLNGIGSIVMVLDAEDDLESVFTLDSFIEVYREHPVTRTLEVEETYLTRLTHRFRDEDRDYFVVGGQSLNHLIKRRVVDPADDPLQAGGYSTKEGPAHEVLRAYAREQMGDLARPQRQIPELSVPPGQPGRYPVGARLRFENLFEVFQDLAQRGRVDFHIRRKTGRQLELFIGPIGVDRTRGTNYARAPMTYLAPERGNLTAPSLEMDRTDEVTVVFAQGQGQGSSRILLEVPSEAVAASPYNRIEAAIDGRSNERNEALALLGEAQDELFKRRAEVTFTFEPTGREPGNIYRLDWDIGDRVTVRWGQEYDVRVTGVEITVSEEGEEISVTVEEDHP